MNIKKLTLAILGALAIASAPAWAAKASFNAAKRHPAPSTRTEAAAVVPSKTAYAWCTRDRGSVAKGIVSFSLDKPGTLKSVHPLNNYAYAGCYANGTYYFDRYRTYSENGTSTWAHIAFSSVDLKTGAVKDIKDWSDEYFVINDMTYDYSTGLIYAMARNIYIDDFLTSLMFEYSCIFTINPTTGVCKEVKSFIDWSTGVTFAPKTYFTLAADLNGMLYSIDQNGYLVKLDPKNDFAETEIGRTGLKPAQTTQSMEFDYTTGTLYWCADYSDKAAELAVVDTASGLASIVGETGTDSHLVGLYIPFDVPADAAPAAVASFEGTPDAAGALSIDLAWTNPTKSYGGYNLASITNVTVSRNNEVIATLTGTPGQAMTYKDNVPAEGLYSYNISCRNSAGAGMASGITRWVGKDVPMAPTNIGIGRTEEGYGYLEWEAPTEGAHGGVLDQASLGYKITRFPDGVIVASDHRGTEFLDTTIPSTGRYYYTIESHTAQGAGEVAKSIEIALGTGISSYPWNTLFKDQSEFDLWTVFDLSGGSTWKWKARTVNSPDGGKYETQAMYEYDHNNDGDDYLISPDLYMKKGARYKLKFAYAGANSYHTEHMEVTFGQGKHPDNHANVLRQLTMTDGTFRYCEIDLPEISETGNYNVAFHATSDAGQYNIYVTDVTVSLTVAPPEEPTQEYDFAAPENILVTVDNNTGTTTITWNESTPEQPQDRTANISEDFECMSKWTINPTGTHGWSYIDGDGGIPYLDDYYEMPYPTDGMPLAAMVMAPYDLHEYVYTNNPPHSGNQYLLFKSNYKGGDGSRPAPKPDDWFISPELNYGQDFIFRFYCKADPDGEGWDPLWNTEYFQVGYSTTDKDPASFTWMTDSPEHVTTSFDEWTKKEYAMPANAKYVCIHYCTQDMGYWFMVDDVFIGVETPAAARAAATPTFKQYDVYVDDELKASTVETSVVLTGISNGMHVAKVEAIYAEGKSEAAVAPFTMAYSSGIEAIDASTDSKAEYYNLQGVRISGKLAPGVYIRRSATGTEKIVVR